MKRVAKVIVMAVALGIGSNALAAELSEEIQTDYSSYLAPLWDHFHRNPELSLMETQTAKRDNRDTHNLLP